MAENKQNTTPERRPDCVTEIRMGNTVLVVSGFFKKDTTDTAADKLPFVVDERAAADLQRPEQPPVEHPCVLILHFVASFPSPRNRR